MRIEILLDEAEPLSGQASADGEAPVTFSGWLGLLRVLERLTASGEGGPPDLGDELDR